MSSPNKTRVPVAPGRSSPRRPRSPAPLAPAGPAPFRYLSASLFSVSVPCTTSVSINFSPFFYVSTTHYTHQ